MNNLVVLVLIATIVMLVLGIGIVTFFVLYQRRIINHQLEIKKITDQKELELLQASIQSEEAERKRIAGELHDDVGVTLSSVRLFLYKADIDAGVLNESRQLLDQSIQKIRNISHQLQPDTLLLLGLESSLQSFAATISKSGVLHVQYISATALPRLKDNIELSVYRIVQELVNNIMKHANATGVQILPQIAGDKFFVYLTHNGQGISNQEFEERIYTKGTTGLKNIVNRIKSVEGTIDFGYANNSYQVTIAVPAVAK